MKALPFPKTSSRPPFRIQKGRAVYAADWKARPYQIWPRPEDQNRVFIGTNQAREYSRGGPWVFNYAVRRSPCVFISGDVPRITLAETLRGPEINPPFHRLGDLRIRIVFEDESFWLDEFGTIHTQYHPWGTIHRVDLRPKLPLEIIVTAALAKTSGVAMKISFEAPPRFRRTGFFDLYFGGLDVSTPGNHWPEYVRAHSAGYPYHVARQVDVEDTIRLGPSGVEIENPKVAFGVAMAVTPSVKPSLVDPDEFRAMEDEHDPRAVELRQRIPGGLRPERRVRFRYPFDALPDEIRIVSWKTGDAAAPPLSVSECDEYLAETQTFFEELLHPIAIKTPDPVIDAAFDSAVINLEYSYEQPAWLEGVHEWNTYFCNNYQFSAATALGQLDRVREALIYVGDNPKGPGGPLATDGSVEDVYNYPHDGLPYYILQLKRYWQATGDTETLRRVWSKTRQNFETLLKARDHDGDQLLNWHMSCNAFLYQSDHLSLPGTAASPSLMAIGMLESMADMAETVGESEPVGAWRRRARYMRREVVRKLWLEDEGRFTSGIDIQGLVQKAAYYTDYVFPILYSGVPVEYGRRSLEALDRDLWLEGQFLRTGNYRPDYFGNNAVHPTAMTEGAEAYFAAGRADRGWALLHGCALGATILTDTPGAFPEYCATTGWGLPDAIFGNPAASFVWAVAAGLFGFERTTPNQMMVWHPCIPAGWEQARFTLDGVAIRTRGKAKDRIYEIELPEARPLECKLPLYGRKLVSVADHDGHTVESACENDFVIVRLPAASSHKLRLKLDGVPRLDYPRVGPPSTSPLPKPKRPMKLRGRRTHLALDNFFNATGFPSPNFATPRLQLANDVNAEGKLVVGSTEFAVRTSGERIVKIEVGQLDREVRGCVATDAPDAVVIPVGQAVVGVEFLLASDCKCRLTGMEIGSVTLRYDNGDEARTPLVFGGNVDCLFLPFATQVEHRELWCDWSIDSTEFLAMFSVAANPRRVLRDIEVRVFAADSVVGLLGVNVVEKGR